jgi:hypothetical protein
MSMAAIGRVGEVLHAQPLLTVQESASESRDSTDLKIKLLGLAGTLFVGLALGGGTMLVRAIAVVGTSGGLEVVLGLIAKWSIPIIGGFAVTVYCGNRIMELNRLLYPLIIENLHEQDSVPALMLILCEIESLKNAVLQTNCIELEPFRAFIKKHAEGDRRIFNEDIEPIHQYLKTSGLGGFYDISQALSKIEEWCRLDGSSLKASFFTSKETGSGEVEQSLRVELDVPNAVARGGGDPLGFTQLLDSYFTKDTPKTFTECPSDFFIELVPFKHQVECKRLESQLRKATRQLDEEIGHLQTAIQTLTDEAKKLRRQRSETQEEQEELLSKISGAVGAIEGYQKLIADKNQEKQVLLAECRQRQQAMPQAAKCQNLCSVPLSFALPTTALPKEDMIWKEPPLFECDLFVVDYDRYKDQHYATFVKKGGVWWFCKHSISDETFESNMKQVEMKQSEVELAIKYARLCHFRKVEQP